MPKSHRYIPMYGYGPMQKAGGAGGGGVVNFPFYGDDQGLIFRHPLTTLSSVDDLASETGYTNLRVFEADGTVSAKRNVIDPVLGLRSTSSDGTVIVPAVNAPVGTDWSVTDGDAGVVISIEVETAWLAGNLTGSTGYTPPSNEVLLAFGPSSTGDCRFIKVSNDRLRFDATSNNNINSLFADWITSADSIANFEMQSIGKDTFTTLQIGFMEWEGVNIGFTALDGMMLKWGAYDGATSSLLYYMSFFAQLHQADSTPDLPFNSAYHIRNLQVSSLAPETTIRIKSSLGNVVGFGDSVTNDDGYTFDGTSYYSDAGWPSQTNRVLISNGVRWRSYRESAQGGTGVKASGAGNNIDDYVGTGAGELFDSTETDPDTVILFIGTNDSVDYVSSADYTAEYVELLELIFGVNSGGTRTSVSSIYCIVPPPRDNSYQTELTGIRTVIRAIEATWDAAHPELAGRVTVGADYEDILGASIPNWLANWSADGVHPNTAANVELGLVLGMAI